MGFASGLSGAKPLGGSLSPFAFDRIATVVLAPVQGLDFVGFVSECFVLKGAGVSAWQRKAFRQQRSRAENLSKRRWNGNFKQALDEAGGGSAATGQKEAFRNARKMEGSIFAAFVCLPPLLMRATFPNGARRAHVGASLAQTRNLLGVSCLDEQEWGAALSALERAKAIDPDSAAYGRNMATVHNLLGSGRFFRFLSPEKKGLPDGAASLRFPGKHGFFLYRNRGIVVDYP